MSDDARWAVTFAAAVGAGSALIGAVHALWQRQPHGAVGWAVAAGWAAMWGHSARGEVDR